MFFSIDFAKSFDSVSHRTKTANLSELGLPKGFINYIVHYCARSEGPSRLLLVWHVVYCRVTPCWTTSFCLVEEMVMKKIPPYVEYELHGHRVGYAAYADDFLPGFVNQGSHVGDPFSCRERHCKWETFVQRIQVHGTFHFPGKET